MKVFFDGLGMRREWSMTGLLRESMAVEKANIRQARKMVYHRSVWQGFMRRNTWGVDRGDEP